MEDHYTIPYARYELAMLWYRKQVRVFKLMFVLTLFQGGSYDVKVMLKKAISYSHKYDFEHRLAIRINLALSQMQPPKEGFE